jgi:hypothetical protein
MTRTDWYATAFFAAWFILGVWGSMPPAGAR